MKELHFIQIGEYLHKEECLQHITEMVNVKLNEGDTYRNLFNKLENLFPDNTNNRKAVETWIKFNIDEQDDQSVFDVVLIKKGEAYASFDLHNLKK